MGFVLSTCIFINACLTGLVDYRGGGGGVREVWWIVGGGGGD